MTFLIVVAVVTGYAAMVGFVGKRAQLWYRHRCPYHPIHDHCDEEDHTAGGVIAGVFWPLALPALIGVVAGGKSDRQTRLEKKRAEELEQAEHDAEVARTRRREAEELSRHLRAVGKSELA